MKPLLCSEIISALGNPKKSLLAYQGGKIADSKIRELRSDLVMAKKFNLSDDFTKQATEASFDKPSVLLDMCNQGLPPFDNIWIEWNEEVRQKAHADLHGVNFDDKLKAQAIPVGYHVKIFKDMLGDAYYLYQAYFKTDEKQIASQMMCFTLANQRENFTYDDYCRKTEALAEVPVYMRAKDEKQWNNTTFEVGSKLLANWYCAKFIPKKILLKHKKTVGKDEVFEVNADIAQELKNYNKSYEWSCLYELFERLGSCQGAPMHWSIPEHVFVRGYTLQEMREFNDAFLVSCEGDARFIIAVLGLMNMNIHKSTDVTPDTKIVHTFNGQRVPRNDYKILDIQLTDRQVKKYYKTVYTGQGAKKREHERRGHWRHYRDDQGNVIYKVWIRSCIAGDKSLGTIDKDYNLI